MSWIDDPLLVHVGLHKTATTWLQSVYFPSPASGFWIASTGAALRHPVKEVGHWFVHDESGSLIDDDAFSADDIRQRLSSLRRPEGLMPVVSYERLAGHPLSGGFDRNVIAHRIRQVFPQARILVTIRSQEPLILSNYMQYLRYGGWHTPEMYLRPPRDNRMPSVSLAYWDYFRLLRTYHGIFGPMNVLFLPQELLRVAPGEFIAALARFCGTGVPDRLDTRIETNARKPAVSSYLLRGLTSLGQKSAANSFAPSLLPLPVGRAIGTSAKLLINMLTPAAVERRFTQHLQARINNAVGDYYRESNRQFSELQAFDLAGLGYKL
jgi:hypothetical protein